MYGFIYITTNTINGKKYLGQSTYKDGHEDYLGSGVLIQRAIKKYGRVCFERKIIDEAETPEKLNELEEHYIKEYGCTQSDQWYNLRGGGSQTNPFEGYNTKELKRWKKNLTKKTKQHYAKPFYCIDIYTGEKTEYTNIKDYTNEFGRRVTLNTRANIIDKNLSIKHVHGHLLILKEHYYEDIIEDALVQNGYYILINSKTRETKLYPYLKDISEVTYGKAQRSVENEIMYDDYAICEYSYLLKNGLDYVLEKYNENHEKFRLRNSIIMIDKTTLEETVFESISVAADSLGSSKALIGDKVRTGKLWKRRYAFVKNHKI